MPQYTVPIVRREKLELWHELWDRDPPTDRAQKANRDGSLGQTVIIKAKNKAEAAEIAEAQNPGHVVICDAIGKIG